MKTPSTQEEVFIGKKLAQEEATLEHAEAIRTAAVGVLDSINIVFEYHNKLREQSKPQHQEALNQSINQLIHDNRWMEASYNSQHIEDAIKKIVSFNALHKDATTDILEHSLTDIAKGLELLIERLTEEIDCIRNGVHRVAAKVIGDSSEETRQIKC